VITSLSRGISYKAECFCYANLLVKADLTVLTVRNLPVNIWTKAILKCSFSFGRILFMQIDLNTFATCNFLLLV
jgi:hypothetical protein